MEKVQKPEVQEKKSFDWKEFLLNNAISIILLLLLIVIVAIEPSFLNIINFRNILSQASTRLIFALGVGGIIIAKGTDLSLGRQVGLAAVISASMMQATGYAYRMYPNLPRLPIIVPVLVVILITVLLSAINGFVVSRLKVDPFVATLGMQVIAFGLTSIYFDRPPYGAQPIGGLDPAFQNWAQGSFNIFGLTIPHLIVFALFITVLVWMLWNKTRFGKNMYAVGGNIEAATVSGVNVFKALMLTYMFAGVLYGLGGALEAARIGSATNRTGEGYELDAIAACIVGGLSFNGGIGTVPGIVFGTLIFMVISYGLNFIGINPYLQYIVKGLIIIIAVAIDSRKYNKR
ncbi:MAG: galactose/methyl galactoside ABC transporter permease MglC [Anaerolineaceae bacterium]|nr:galactose/methyl galactoside ABC transporter permease MglC [Anaerolineaceae bacterium]